MGSGFLLHPPLPGKRYSKLSESLRHIKPTYFNVMLPDPAATTLPHEHTKVRGEKLLPIHSEAVTFKHPILEGQMNPARVHGSYTFIGISGSIGHMTPGFVWTARFLLLVSRE